MKYEDFGINIPADKLTSKGEIKILCPKCSHTRKKNKEPCLNINLDKKVWNCKHCGFKGSLKERTESKEYELPPEKDKYNLDSSLQYFKERGISKETLDHFHIYETLRYVAEVNDKVRMVSFPFLWDGRIVNCKYRSRDKKFQMAKGGKLIPYNIDNIEEDYVIITEGEIDTHTYHECGFTSVISVPNGAQITQEEKEYYEKHKIFLNKNVINLSYFDPIVYKLEKVKTIYIATDTDIPGEKLSNEIARRFGKHRCKRVTYDIYKDINELYVNTHFDKNIVRETITNAKDYPITGLIKINDVKKEIFRDYKHGLEKGITTGYPELDPHLKLRLGHTLAINGYPGNGKTSFALQLALNTAKMYNWKWGIYSPENYPVKDLYQTLIEIYLGNTIDREKKERATILQVNNAMEFINEYIYVIDDNEEEVFTPRALRDKYRDMIVKHGINAFIKDPWNSLSHDTKISLNDYLQKELLQETKFAIHNNVYNVINVHPITPSTDRNKSLGPPSAYTISGGAMWMNKLYEIICIHRDYDNYKDTQTEIHVQKVKFQKLIGLPTEPDRPVFLNYDRRSSRYYSAVENSIHPLENVSKQELINF